MFLGSFLFEVHHIFLKGVEIDKPKQNVISVFVGCFVLSLVIFEGFHESLDRFVIEHVFDFRINDLVKNFNKISVDLSVLELVFFFLVELLVRLDIEFLHVLLEIRILNEVGNSLEDLHVL